MPKKLSETEAKKILGVAGDNTHNGGIRADEFLPELRGKKAIRKFREMRDNDSTIGAVMYATEQVLRDVELKVVPANDSAEAKAEAEFLETVLDDMDHTLDDHIAEALSCLSYGFSWFEVVYKRRGGPKYRDYKKHSKYTDGRIGIRKLAARAPWTVSKFDVDQKSGEVLGLYQEGSLFGKTHYIPASKSLYYRTTTINGDPSGRSVLRNAFTSYEYLSNLQAIEAIAVERELAGIPVARIPSEYLSSDATASQVAMRSELQGILRDVKFNEQGYIILPSDTYPDKDGAPTDVRLMDIELMASSGTRNIQIDPIINRYQHDIARSVLSEFLLLGAHSAGGSYALSKSKTDLFLRALESYISAITDVLNKQLVEALWKINGLPFDNMPCIKAGDVAPHDLKEIAAFLRNLNGADINVSHHPEVIQDLMDIAELTYDPDVPEPKEPEPKEVPEEESEESKKFQQLELELLEKSLEILNSESQ